MPSAFVAPVAVFALLLAGLAAGVQAQPSNDAGNGARAPKAAAARVIVGFKADAPLLRAQALSAATDRATAATRAQRRADGLAARAGVALAAGRLLGARAMVVRAAGLDSETLAARLARHPELAYAVPDRRRHALTVPNDPLFAAGPAGGNGPAVGQWYLRAPDGSAPSSANAVEAWRHVVGQPGIVVAVIDTGVLATHVDLSGRVLPGRDLVDDLATANDGDGRDADASDPGDWITTAEDAESGGPFHQCGSADSSWHGTQVAGIVGAVADNGLGMAGAAHGVRILPVRVLGKCGGFDSDIIAGIYWAAGIDQPGLPGSSTPARVLNLSLGGSGGCSSPYRDAVAALAAAPRHAVVVAAAGNSAGLAVGTPANCPGVIGVAGLRHTGSKVGFSDLGPEVSIAAPAGNCVNIEAAAPCLYPILSTSNSGTRQPLAGASIWTDSFNITVGTSFASPIVASAAALLLSARPSLTPPEVKSILQRNARPFPTSGSDNGPGDPTPVPMCRAPNGSDQLQCYCSTALCGAGMLDIAAAALEAVQGLPLAESARQLLDFGESAYAAHFPGPATTQTFGPFLYRHYPATGTYLGVAVKSDASYELNGVYVMGGPFGDSPQYVGRLRDYIVPRLP